MVLKMRRTKTYLAEREKRILEFVDRNGFISVEQVCSMFDISSSSARTQLNSMSKRGLIERSRGGASSLSAPGNNNAGPDSPAASSGVRSKEISCRKNYAEKISICKAVKELISEGDIIGIFGGSTTYLLSTFLHEFNRLTVVTNSVWIADELSNYPHINVRMCGGTLNHEKGTLNGHEAEDFFLKTRFDKAIVGADKLSLDYGAVSGDSFISHLEHIVLMQAKETIIMCDHDKIGTDVYTDSVASFKEMDYIVTDSGTNQEYVDFITKAGVKVIVGK